MLLNHDKKYCHITNAWSLTNPTVEAEGSRILESEQIPLSDKNAEFLGLEAHIDHKVSKNEKKKFPIEIQKLCYGIPTFFVNYKKTSLSKEEFLEDDFTTTTTVENFRSDQTRFKREFTMSDCPTFASKVTDDTYFQQFR